MDALAGNVAEVKTKRRGWGLYASHIGPNGSYMRRFIIRTPWGTIRLHNILRSDDDRHLHDHPFDFVSILLTGGYFERAPCVTCGGHGQIELPGTGVGDRDATDCPMCFDGKRTSYWPRFSIVRKRAEDLHCLTLTKPVWTLVFSGPKRRDWGFATEHGWVHNEQYAQRWPERVTNA